VTVPRLLVLHHWWDYFERKDISQRFLKLMKPTQQRNEEYEALIDSGSCSSHSGVLHAALEKSLLSLSFSFSLFP